MNIKYVREKLKEIERLGIIEGDDEAAHDREDDLYIEVLTYIADGIPAKIASSLAKEALKARKLDFCRWCA